MKEKTPADSGGLRKTVDVPPEPAGEGSGRRPRDAADPRLTDEERTARIGSAGGGSYAPGAPGHDVADDASQRPVPAAPVDVDVDAQRPTA
jgi:hypothetical protein